MIADPIVRLWGTVGGSLCQADPSEDLSAAFAALEATMVIANLDGTRTVPARAFHVGPYETVVGPGEILTEIRISILPGGAVGERQCVREGRPPGRGLAGGRRRRGPVAGRPGG